jgi:hypothetical protein
LNGAIVSLLSAHTKKVSVGKVKLKLGFQGDSVDRSSTWAVNPDGGKENGASYEVLAWARHKESGEPVYIMELDANHAGANCGCECPSCNLDLIAINVGKTEYRRRPHFRHPAGAIKSDCMFISARLAAMRLFKSDGFILLPRRHRTATAVGISGTQYGGFFETQPQRMAIKDFSFKDRAVAILTLANGRKLHVDLVGKGAVLSDDGKPTACISLNINDPAIAGMSLDDLRANISLIPDHLCWLSHWDDEELTAKALTNAESKADDFMDLQSRYAVDLEFIDKNLRHETVLHWEVKNILAEAMELRVPKLEVLASKQAANGQQIQMSWTINSHVIPLLSVKTEQRLGSLIPDVIAITAPEHGSTLIVEVTVTNTIDEARINRIRQQNLPTLEIDLSRSGGLVSRDELKEIVLNGLDLKRWLHHPERDKQSDILTAEVESEVIEINQKLLKEQQQRQEILNTPIETIVEKYISLIMEIAGFDTLDSMQPSDRLKLQSLETELKEVSKKLAIHGYPEAADDDLTMGRRGIIPRVLSIKLGRGIGYKLNSTMEVMNAIKQSSDRNSFNHTIYMIAERVYRPTESPENPSWYVEWVNGVKASIKSGEFTYIRDDRYDKLLSLLFPEMATALSKPIRKTSPSDFDANRQIKYNLEWWQRKRNTDSHSRVTHKVQKVMDEYSGGYYRAYGQRVDFEQILVDAVAISKGESYSKWFEIWSNRYGLAYDVHPIARLLSAAGFTDAINQWHDWNRYVQSVKSQTNYKYTRSELDPHKDVFVPKSASSVYTSREVKEQPNLYAEMKGRSGPRKPK